MKKSFTVASILLALALCFVAAFAAGGDADDPLLSLSYLEGIFKQDTENTIDAVLDSADEQLLDDAQQMLGEMAFGSLTTAGKDFASVAKDVIMNESDRLNASSGLSLITYAGDIVVDITVGTVLDVTTGEEIPDGTILSTNHRYIVAENSVANFIVTSPIAILSYQGHYSYTPNEDAVDYYGIALALRELGLFRGSGSGIGEGFDLHREPTRAEALVMFIRIIGEEKAALACTYEHPFTDVPEWLDRYAAWAYHKGYSNGIGDNKFGSLLTVSAVEYQEFLLRALGYSTAGVDDYRTSLARALEHGILTDAEYFLMSDTTFLRAHVAYLSYYHLDVKLANSYISLGQNLQRYGVFTLHQRIMSREYVSSERLH